MSKKRLRPWLEARLDADNIPGLRWLNNEKTLFRITWKHGGKQQWTEEDAQIFKEWAIHTGRFSEGVDTPDHATWKTRLRCAMNKSDDINERKDLSRTAIDEAYKVFEFKRDQPVGLEAKAAPGQSKVKVEHSGPISITTQPMIKVEHSGPLSSTELGLPNKTELKQEIKTEVLDFESEERLDSDLDRIPTEDLIRSGTTSFTKTSFTADDKNQLDNFLDGSLQHAGAMQSQLPDYSAMDNPHPDLQAYELLTDPCITENLDLLMAASNLTPELTANQIDGLSPGNVDQIGGLSPAHVIQIGGISPTHMDSTGAGILSPDGTVWSPLSPQDLGIDDTFAQPSQSICMDQYNEIVEFTQNLSPQDRLALQKVDTALQISLSYSGSSVSTKTCITPMHIYAEGKIIDKQKLRLTDKPLLDIPLPDPGAFMPECQKLTNTREVLGRMSNGVLIECQNGDIYLTRWCMTKIFCSSKYCPFRELKRNQRTKVFDINDFLLALKHWTNGPKPAEDVHLSLGCEWRLNENSQADAFVLATVCSVKARTYLQLYDDRQKAGALYSMTGMSSFTSDMESSLPPL